MSSSERSSQTSVSPSEAAHPMAEVRHESVTGVPPIQIGIPTEQREAIAAGLSRLLADEYTLYLKTHYYHWNVTGPMFNTLHLMFETQYTALALAVDAVAERIRALGVFAPGSYRQFAELSSVDDDAAVPDALSMVRNLLLAREACVRTARSVIALAQQGGDEPSADLLTQRLQEHEKTAWMLRSLLQ